MDSRVKLKLRKPKHDGMIKEFSFEEAQNILANDKHKDFEIAEPTLFSFDKAKKELIKLKPLSAKQQKELDEKMK